MSFFHVSALAFPCQGGALPFFTAFQSRSLRMDRHAAFLARMLHDQPRQTIAEAQNNAIVLAARAFVKTLTVNSSKIQRLKSELLAAKLGLEREIFDANPGLEEFVVKYHLERYLLEYKHKIFVDSEKKVWLKTEVEGSSVCKKWEDVKDAFVRFHGRLQGPSQPWVYGLLGLQKKDMYDWDMLIPYKMEDPSQWDKKHIFEICVFLTGSPRSLTGNHTWLRLRTPAGEVYSVGLYRTGKHGAYQHWEKPLRVMPGELMAPDVSEFWPGEVRSLQIAITKKAFEDVKRTIEMEKRRGEQPFEDFDPNCTKWVVEKAKIAGITLKASENLVSLFLPRKVEAVAKKVWAYVPAKRFLRPIGSVITAACINSLQLVLGAGSVDPALSQKAEVRPRIASLRELFDPEKMIAYHPYTLADKTMAEIFSWREQQRERILREDSQDKEAELQRIKYAVPS